MPIIAITTKIMNMEVADIKTNKGIDERCKTCFQKTYNRLFLKYDVGATQRLVFFIFLRDVLNKYKKMSSPEIQRILNNKFCQIIGVTDPFDDEKDYCNQSALELYKIWKPKVLNSENPYDLALRLAIAGNIMDYGANNSFDLNKTINDVIHAEFAIDHSFLLQQKIKQAKKILYLGDNAGEIVFDRLFIETIMHNQISYAVKGFPVLNDVTTKDAKDVEMEIVADIISNGFDAPSTILNSCSREFREVFKSADLIISKGQGNLEGLIDMQDRRIFFLLMVKCEVIAEILEVEKGSIVVYNQNNN